MTAMVSSMRLFLILAGILFITISTDAQESLDPVDYFGGETEGNEAYLEWLQTKGNSYSRTAFLPSPAGNATGVALHWTIQDDEIFLAVAAKATGWIAFGIAESGGMFGADVVMYMASTDSLVDGHILDERFVVPDDCQSWTLHNSTNIGGFLIFEAVRLLDTGDSQDRPIPRDGAVATPASRAIAAWSDLPSLQNHGPNNRASTVLRFHGTEDANDFSAAMAAEAEGFIEIKAQDYPVKPIDTEYVYFCLSNADLIAQGMPNNTELHGIGFEPIIDPRAVKHVHHFILQASEQGEAANGSTCGDMDFTQMAYLWAPGEGPLQLPDNVGSPLGDGGFKSFQLEIHYDNPWLETGVLDSSGVRLYYTSQKRQEDLGILSLGDPFVQLMDKSVGNGLASNKFDCPASCSSFVLNQNITVVREYLHMHKAGASMSNNHIRDGQVIRSAQVQFYDFSQQGAYAVQQEPYQILPGDGFQTLCQYKATNDTVFGLSSSQEMCIAFLIYHPRQTMSLGGLEIPFTCGYDIPIPGCVSDWQQTNLESAADLNRTFGSVGEVCNGEAVNSGVSTVSLVVSVVFALTTAVLISIL